MAKRTDLPHRIITENMLRRMNQLIEDGVVKSRTRVATKLCMNVNSIYRIERDPSHTFTLEQFCRFCRVYEIDPKELFPK